MTETKPFRLPATDSANGVFTEWAVRRLDGQPWRSEPRHEGDSHYYTLDDEISADAMVLHARDAIDAIAILLSQHEDADDSLPHPGEVAVVHRVFRSYPNDQENPGWRTWWVDVDSEDLVRHLNLVIQTCARYLPALAVLTHERKADQ